MTLILLALLLSWSTGIGSVSYRQQIQQPELTATPATSGEVLEATPKIFADLFPVFRQSERLSFGIHRSRLIPSPLLPFPHRTAVPTDASLPRPPPAV